MNILFTKNFSKTDKQLYVSDQLKKLKLTNKHKLINIQSINLDEFLQSTHQVLCLFDVKMYFFQQI